MAFARLEHDFPVIEGPQGSLPLTVVSSSNESATVLQCFPCLQRGLKGHSYSVLEEPGQLSRVSSMGRIWSSWAVGFAGFEAGGADGSGADGLEGSDRDFLGQAEDSCVCWMFPRVEAVCASLYCPPSF